MNNFVTLPLNWTPETNFWDFNGQLAIVAPFDKIYNLDKGGDKSSKLMTIVFFMCDPDEEKNRFYRLPEEDRKQMLKETYYPDIDWDNKLLVAAISKYPEVCLTAVARTLKDTKDFLTRRSEYLRTVPYNLETMKDIDMAISKSVKIYEDFEKIQQKFVEHEKVGRIRGGRRETEVEKGNL